MNDLVEQYRAQIEALQRELDRKNQIITRASELINEFHELMKKEQEGDAPEV